MGHLPSWLWSLKALLLLSLMRHQLGVLLGVALRLRLCWPRRILLLVLLLLLERPLLLTWQGWSRPVAGGWIGTTKEGDGSILDRRLLLGHCADQSGLLHTVVSGWRGEEMMMVSG
ncbi:hypothetical protein EDD21DRAFT_386154 [Dissophora ornata]|nr:hypothetical protein EDD21DRAFT_386154 [Dissophora ornata]